MKAINFHSPQSYASNYPHIFIDPNTQKKSQNTVIFIFQTVHNAFTVATVIERLTVVHCRLHKFHYAPGSANNALQSR